MAGREGLQADSVALELDRCRNNHLARRFDPGFVPGFDFEDLPLDAALLRAVFLLAGFTRSGRLAPPVSRFHPSKVSSEISPLTRSYANLRRWALLLKGIVSVPPFPE